MIIDSFIVAGESKWGQTTRLTLLLPHGYEGAGPEHSSARIERFIQLGSEGNIRLANPTTAAQYFHLLRRQARIAKPRPLVVFTPKGLLRLKAAASSLEELTTGQFQFVLDDPTAPRIARQVERLVLCSGKVFYDIDRHDRREAAELGGDRPGRAAVSVRAQRARAPDRLLPEPEEGRLGPGGAEEHGRLERDGPPPARAAPRGRRVQYVGRPQRSSPSEGYPAAHRLEQERIVLTALEG